MNTKRKGNAFEIKIAKRLSKWITGKDKSLLFWKVGSSGAQATITKDKKSKLVGDLVAIDGRGAWLTDVVVVEMKNDKRANALDFIDTTNRKKNWLYDVWIDLVNKSDEAGRFPWLIFHRPETRIDYIVIDKKFIYELIAMDSNCLKFDTGYIYELEDFLYRCKPVFMKGNM